MLVQKKYLNVFVITNYDFQNLFWLRCQIILGFEENYSVTNFCRHIYKIYASKEKHYLPLTIATNV